MFCPAITALGSCRMPTRYVISSTRTQWKRHILRGMVQQKQTINRNAKAVSSRARHAHATAWIVDYDLFSKLVTHSNVESFQTKMQNSDTSNGQAPATMQSPAAPRSRRAVFDDSSGIRTTGIPPPLTPNLTLDVVSKLWQRDSALEPDCGLVRSNTKRCPFFWVSDMVAGNASLIKGYFSSIIQSPHEWNVVDDKKKADDFKKNTKLGWIPLPRFTSLKIVMEFNVTDHAVENIQSVTLFYLKSYGTKWEGSTLTMTIERKVRDEWVSAQANPVQLLGTRGKKTSEPHIETLHLLQQEADASAVWVTLTLTEGRTFQLMGISVCQ